MSRYEKINSFLIVVSPGKLLIKLWKDKQTPPSSFKLNEVYILQITGQTQHDVLLYIKNINFSSSIYNQKCKFAKLKGGRECENRKAFEFLWA